jgi:hypothetical protein
LQALFTSSLQITSMTENKQKPQKPLTHEGLVDLMLENEEVYKALAEYELNKSTGAVQRVDND